MAKTTKIPLLNRFNGDNIFIFLFLVIFPFGQIIRIGIIQPIDIVCGLAAIYSILKKLKKPEVLNKINVFIVTALFSWILSIFIFKNLFVFYGLLYLIRLTAYSYFLVYVYNFAKKGVNKQLLINAILLVSVICALFGWIQFFTVPDIKPFFKLGWDMHLYRLVGTFLDPTFLGLIIVFGLIISIYKLIDIKNWKYFFISIFMIFSLGFTYSRSSYLAFLFALLLVGFYKKIIIPTFLVAALFIMAVFLLPTARNHSIQIFRSFSAIARIENYKTTLMIFSKSPVFGIGYDNMCLAYNKFIGPQKIKSHACSGSDSSLLFILATTGTTGLIIFFKVLSDFKVSLKSGINKQILITSFLVAMVHSIFSNSLFYPWIIGWFMILIAISV